jgi:AcrR family transcriptional regulator
MLNMRSTSDDASDRTARARIRDAAIRCFAEDGVAGTSVRTIAAAADVSAGLVLHHFGSKEELRTACDRHVAALVRATKTDAMRAGPGLDPVAGLRQQGDGPPLLAYLARTLVDGSPHVAELIDEMVADAAEYMAEGERSGVLRPTEDRYGRAAVLTLWSLGALVLREHTQRLLGVDLTGDPAGAMPYFRPAAEILGEGVITEAAYEQMRRALEATKEEPR